MKTNTIATLLAASVLPGALLLGVLAPTAAAQETNGPLFTYQALLIRDGVPANGGYDMRWTLYDSETNGTALGNPLTTSNIMVSNGLFTVELPVNALGPQPEPPDVPPLLANDPLWLEILVRPVGGGPDPFSLLGPRQKFLHAPRAAYAGMALVAFDTWDNSVDSAAVRDGALEGVDLAMGAVGTRELADGAVTRPKLPDEVIGTAQLADMSVTMGKLGMDSVMMENIMDYSVTGPKLANGSVVRSLNNLQENLVLSAGTGLALNIASNQITFSAVRNCADYAQCYWSLLGNNINAGVNFLGTAAGELDPLEFRVNNHRAMQYVFTAPTTSPNLIGGFEGNMVTGVGGTIAGGGRASAINVVKGDWGAIGGGYTNVIDAAAPYATIAGGYYNYSGGEAGAIGGGSLNRILTSSFYGTIAGGWQNSVEAYHADIGGGLFNRIQNGAQASTIGGGSNNLIYPYAPYGFIGGGQANLVSSNANHGVIGGGLQNKVEGSVQYGTVGGGQANTAGATWSTVAGGVNNRAGGAASSVGGGNYNTANGGGATISGGDFNSATGWRAAVGGGANNTASADTSSIGGGVSNQVQSAATAGTIGGGVGNAIRTASSSSTIAGGGGNLINTNAPYAAIGGGHTNQIAVGAGYATIGGGRSNTIAGAAQHATIPGGLQANAANFGQMAYASGAFAAVGDAQSSVYVLRRTTTTNIATELFLDGAAQRMRVPADATWAFDILIIGRTSATYSAGYHIRGVIENNAGITVLDGTLLKDILNEDDAAWDATVIADSTNDALVIQVTGSATDTVRWVATVRAVEVTFP